MSERRAPVVAEEIPTVVSDSAALEQAGLVNHETRQETLSALEEIYGGRVFAFRTYKGTVSEMAEACPMFRMKLNKGVDAAMSWLEKYDGVGVVEEEVQEPEEEKLQFMEEPTPEPAAVQSTAEVETKQEKTPQYREELAPISSATEERPNAAMEVEPVVREQELQGARQEVAEVFEQIETDASTNADSEPALESEVDLGRTDTATEQVESAGRDDIEMINDAAVDSPRELTAPDEQDAIAISDESSSVGESIPNIPMAELTEISAPTEEVQKDPAEHVVVYETVSAEEMVVEEASSHEVTVLDTDDTAQDDSRREETELEISEEMAEPVFEDETTSVDDQNFVDITGTLDDSQVDEQEGFVSTEQPKIDMLLEEDMDVEVEPSDLMSDETLAYVQDTMGEQLETEAVSEQYVEPEFRTYADVLRAEVQPEDVAQHTESSIQRTTLVTEQQQETLDELQPEAQAQVYAAAARAEQAATSLLQATTEAECHEAREAMAEEIMTLLELLGYDSPREVMADILKTYDIGELRELLQHFLSANRIAAGKGHDWLSRVSSYIAAHAILVHNYETIERAA